MARLLLDLELGKGFFKKGMKECKTNDKCPQRNTLHECTLNDLVQHIYWFCICYMMNSFYRKLWVQDLPAQNEFNPQSICDWGRS